MKKISLFRIRLKIRRGTEDERWEYYDVKDLSLILEIAN